MQQAISTVTITEVRSNLAKIVDSIESDGMMLLAA